jgi:hypothetical protein
MPGRPPTSVSSTIVTPFRSPSASYCRHWTQPSIKRGFEAPSSIGAFDCFLKSEENMSLFNRPRAPRLSHARRLQLAQVWPLRFSSNSVSHKQHTRDPSGPWRTLLSTLQTLHHTLRCATPSPWQRKHHCTTYRQNLCVHTFRLFSSPSRHTKQRTHAHIQNLAPNKSALIFDSSHLRSPHLLFCR